MTPLTDIDCALISPEGTSLENILPQPPVMAELLPMDFLAEVFTIWASTL